MGTSQPKPINSRSAGQPVPVWERRAAQRSSVSSVWPSTATPDHLQANPMRQSFCPRLGIVALSACVEPISLGYLLAWCVQYSACNDLGVAG